MNCSFSVLPAMAPVEHSPGGDRGLHGVEVAGADEGLVLGGAVAGALPARTRAAAAANSRTCRRRGRREASSNIDRFSACQPASVMNWKR